MYNFITHHLYIVLCVHLLKSSLLPSLLILPIPSPTFPSPPASLVINMLFSVYERSISFNGTRIFSREKVFFSLRSAYKDSTCLPTAFKELST